jgi:hypothetical protein
MLPVGSRTFDQLLSDAEEQLWLGFRRAGNKKHRGSRGASREEALAEFLTEQLPGRFGVTTGEAIDSGERRTGQLDVIVYDRHLTAPLLTEKSGDLLPAESLLAVIEVKSKLTKAEALKCARAAKSVAKLRPYGKAFVASRKDGLPADDGRHRCLYSVLAFSSDLSIAKWPENEWARFEKAVDDASVSRERIDRVLVLDRGMIVPTTATARTASSGGKTMLRDWFLHLTNFIVREAARRPDFDFNAYGRSRKQGGWKKLG